MPANPARRAAFPDLLVFASGANMPAEIEGFAAIGHHVGVAAPEVRAAAEAALLALPQSTHVFLDSGAYSEVNTKVSPPVVVAPITPSEWEKRLALYARLATALGPRLHVVAPDRVASQEETLQRLRRYAAEMRYVASTGAEILLPLQPGPLSFLDFERYAQAALGGIPITPAIPMRQKATRVADLVAWVRERRPARVHLLGLGEHNRDAPKIIAAIRQQSPETVISLDANRITSAAGRTGGKGGPGFRVEAGGGPNQRDQRRALTVWTDYVEMRDSAERWGDEYEENIGTPSSWLSKDELEAVAASAMLDPDVARRWLRDPDTFPDEEDRAYLDEALDEAWGAYALKQQTHQRRRDGVELAFGSELRGVTVGSIFAVLYKTAVDRMMRKGSALREIELVEYLDEKWYADKVRAAIARGLEGARHPQPVFVGGDAHVGVARPLVIACSETKRPGRLPAIDKYDGPLWRSLRAHKGQFSRPIYVLSAEHGLVPVSTPMDDYDRVIVEGRPKSAKEITPAQRAPLVAQQAKALGIQSVDFAGGRAYVDTLQLAGVEVHRVASAMPGHDIGYQRQALKAHLGGA